MVVPIAHLFSLVPRQALGNQPNEHLENMKTTVMQTAVPSSTSDGLMPIPTPSRLKRITGKGLWEPFGFSIDTILFIGLILLANLHLVTGGSCRPLIFLPGDFMSGEWYRLFSFPFAHLSGYHLALDAGAFLLLYSGLREKRISRKLFHVGICGIGSLAAALLFAPPIYTQGLCGLSGIAHGLMAVSALEMLGEPRQFRAGFTCLAIICGKSIYEALTGEVLFGFMHLGLCGSPLAVCHAGGVAGGLMSYFLLTRAAGRHPANDNKQDGQP